MENNKKRRHRLHRTADYSLHSSEIMQGNKLELAVGAVSYLDMCGARLNHFSGRSALRLRG